MAIGTACTALTAQANVWSFGGTRVAGMGGAGLALPFDIVDNNRLNPAMLGYGPNRFGFGMPSLDYDLDGVDIKKISDDFSNVGKGGITTNASKLESFAAQFGQRTHNFDFDFTAGLYGYGFAANGIGQALVSTVPNASLQTWSKSGGNQTSFPSDAVLDAYGIGYYSYGFSYGHKVPIQSTDLSVGAAINFFKAYYTHQILESNGSDGAQVVSGPELGGKNDIGKSGAGFDVAALGKSMCLGSTNKIPLFYGAVVRNVVQPNIKFTEQLPNGSPSQQTLDPFKRRIDAGLGTVLEDRLMLAADWDDVGNNTGFAQVGVGAEYKLYGNTAVRAGYNSLSGLSVGASVFGFNVAVSGRRTAVIGTSVKF